MDGTRSQPEETQSRTKHRSSEDKRANLVSEIEDRECPADTSTTRVIPRVMGKLRAVLGVLVATPPPNLPKEQRHRLARELAATAALLRGP